MFFSPFLSKLLKSKLSSKERPRGSILRRIGFAETKGILANISPISRRRHSGYWRSGVMKASPRYGCSKKSQRIRMRRCTASISKRHLSGRTFSLLDRLQKFALKMDFLIICFYYAQRTLSMLFMSMEATARWKCMKMPYSRFAFSNAAELWVSPGFSGRNT